MRGGFSLISRCSIFRINRLSHRESESEGGRSGPSSAGYRVYQHEVERCESLSVSGYTKHSDEDAAKHGARSGKGAAAGKEWNDETGSVIIHGQP